MCLIYYNNRLKKPHTNWKFDISKWNQSINLHMSAAHIYKRAYVCAAQKPINTYNIYWFKSHTQCMFVYMQSDPFLFSSQVSHSEYMLCYPFAFSHLVQYILYIFKIWSITFSVQAVQCQNLSKQKKLVNWMLAIVDIWTGRLFAFVCLFHFYWIS